MKRKLVFADEAWDDYLFWQGTDCSSFCRIGQLIKEIRRSPYEGIGKPELLKHQLSGWWSRRIEGEHRFVYRVTEQSLEISNLRIHY